MIFTWFANEIVWCDHIFVFCSNSLSIPPGTKVYLTGSITVQESFLMLDANNTRVLGGEVEKLKEKWELNKVRAFHMLLFRGVLFWSCFKLVFNLRLHAIDCKSTMSQPFNSQDSISNSPYCLPYSSCDVSLENLGLDRLIIP